MTSGSTGSDYEPTPVVAARLARWRAMASRGVPVADIAQALRITRAALDQSVCRARRRGHPDAILHPAAADVGNGTSHLTDSTERARRIQRHTTERPTP